MKAKKNNDGRKFYEHKPIREFKAQISKDGKYWLLKDITTHVVPRGYLSKIEADSLKSKVSDALSEIGNSSSQVE